MKPISARLTDNSRPRGKAAIWATAIHTPAGHQSHMNRICVKLPTGTQAN
jgi:hypothetical protein